MRNGKQPTLATPHSQFHIKYGLFSQWPSWHSRVDLHTWIWGSCLSQIWIRFQNLLENSDSVSIYKTHMKNSGPPWKSTWKFWICSQNPTTNFGLPLPNKNLGSTIFDISPISQLKCFQQPGPFSPDKMFIGKIELCDWLGVLFKISEVWLTLLPWLKVSII